MISLVTIENKIPPFKGKDYFSDNLIEGIVIRHPLSTMSAKVMNDEYDSKK